MVTVTAVVVTTATTGVAVKDTTEATEAVVTGLDICLVLMVFEATTVTVLDPTLEVVVVVVVTVVLTAVLEGIMEFWEEAAILTADCADCITTSGWANKV